jgi:hypothetical protein
MLELVEPGFISFLNLSAVQPLSQLHGNLRKPIIVLNYFMNRAAKRDFSDSIVDQNLKQKS